MCVCVCVFVCVCVCLLSYRNGHDDPSSGEDDCISDCTEIHEKCMNPTILPPPIGKIVEPPGARKKKSLNSNLLNTALKLTLCRFLFMRRGWIYIYMMLLVNYSLTNHKHMCKYIHKVSDRSQERPEVSLFNSYLTEV